MVGENKTYKRELAVIMLLVLYYAGFKSADPTMKYVFEILVGPTFLFVAAAFGLDSVAKQWNKK